MMCGEGAKQGRKHKPEQEQRWRWDWRIDSLVVLSTVSPFWCSNQHSAPAADAAAVCT